MEIEYPPPGLSGILYTAMRASIKASRLAVVNVCVVNASRAIAVVIFTENASGVGAEVATATGAEVATATRAKLATATRAKLANFAGVGGEVKLARVKKRAKPTRVKYRLNDANAVPRAKNAAAGLK